MMEAAAFEAHHTGSQIRPCRLLELHAQAGGSLQPTQALTPQTPEDVGMMVSRAC